MQRRLGRLAGLIVACDALVQWCGGLIDEGYRGEMECVIAKIFGSESQKEAAIELLMKTHGGRSFLHGHMFGDNVHEYLAPCIYEGEGEMLAMAFFKSLVKQHGVQFFEPIGKALQAAGMKKPNMANPAHLWALRGVIAPYAKWLAGQYMRPKPRPQLPSMPESLRRHADFAATFLQRSPREISGTMSKHQLGLADRQCRMSELSQRIQDAVTILCTSLYAARPGRRSRPRGRRHLLPGSDPQDHRRQSERQVLQEGHQARPGDHRRRLQIDRRVGSRRDSDAVRQSVGRLGVCKRRKRTGATVSAVAPCFCLRPATHKLTGDHAAGVLVGNSRAAHNELSGPTAPDACFSPVCGLSQPASPCNRPLTA